MKVIFGVGFSPYDIALGYAPHPEPKVMVAWMTLSQSVSSKFSNPIHLATRQSI